MLMVPTFAAPIKLLFFLSEVLKLSEAITNFQTKLNLTISAAGVRFHENLGFTCCPNLSSLLISKEIFKAVGNDGLKLIIEIVCG